VFDGFIVLWVATELICRIPILRQRVRHTFDPHGSSSGSRSWAAGLAIAASGVVLRSWAIVTLGRFFTYDVTIQPGHRVVTSEPYRWVRHPSYTGGLLGLLGLGVALGSGTAVLALVVVPLIGVLNRILHEERTLRMALGAEYDAYTARTPRLIPSIW